MAALLHHRKLMFSDDDGAMEQPCEGACSYPTSFHDSVICPPECFNVCPSICNDNNSPPNVDPNAIYVAAVLPVIMTTVLICGCLSIYKWTAGQSHVQPPQELYAGGVADRPWWYVRTTGGLHSSVINAIEIRRYRKGEGAVEGLECPVCLSEFREDEILRILPNCKHGFHVPCVDTWLKSHANCPVCRAGVESAGNSDVVPAMLVLTGEHGGIPVSNGREREESEAHEVVRNAVNEKEDESTEQNVVPKSNIVEHS